MQVFTWFPGKHAALQVLTQSLQTGRCHSDPHPNLTGPLGAWKAEGRGRVTWPSLLTQMDGAGAQLEARWGPCVL